MDNPLDTPHTIGIHQDSDLLPSYRHLGKHFWN
jgi:hypothetical protein